jgi:hypothetical protein
MSADRGSRSAIVEGVSESTGSRLYGDNRVSCVWRVDGERVVVVTPRPSDASERQAFPKDRFNGLRHHLPPFLTRRSTARNTIPEAECSLIFIKHNQYARMQ